MTLNDLLEALVVGKRLLLKSCANWSTNTYFHFAISWFYVSMVPFLAAGAPQAPAALGLRSRRAGQVNGAGLSPTGDWKWTGGPGCRRGWGGPCMCLCTVYGSHRVHVFENQKHFLLYHQSFSQKLENTKKKNQFQLCTSRLWCLWFPASCRLLTLTRLAVWATSGEAVSRRFTSDPRPEGCASWCKTGPFCTTGFGGRVQAGTRCIVRNRDTPQVRYQVLKRRGFTLFQSRFRLPSFNKTITIVACVICLCVYLFVSKRKTAFTPHWT